MIVVICPSCGTENPGNRLICKHCGENIVHVKRIDNGRPNPIQLAGYAVCLLMFICAMPGFFTYAKPALQISLLAGLLTGGGIWLWQKKHPAKLDEAGNKIVPPVVQKTLFVLIILYFLLGIYWSVVYGIVGDEGSNPVSLTLYILFFFGTGYILVLSIESTLRFLVKKWIIRV